MKKAQSTLIIPLCLLLIFTLPMLAAWIYYWDGRQFITKTTNIGQLIQPPISITKLTWTTKEGQAINGGYLHGKWLLLYLQPHFCNQSCINNIYYLQQIKRATGKEQNRIENIILTFKTSLNDSQLQKLLQKYGNNLTHFIVTRSALAQLVKNLPSQKFMLTSEVSYIVDPLGNMVLSYKSPLNARGLYKDLNKLLKVSQIG